MAVEILGMFGLPSVIQIVSAEFSNLTEDKIPHSWILW